MSRARGEGAELAEEGRVNVMSGVGMKRVEKVAVAKSAARKWLSLGGRRSRERLGEIEWL